MRVLGIHGSPRKGGNTDVMLDAFLAGAQEAGAEVQRIYVRRLKIQGCLGCGGCDETGECVVDDGMSEVYPLLKGADRVVLASPIYFYGLTGSLKLLVDRSQACFMGHQLAKQAGTHVAGANGRGFLLSAGATRGKRLFECAILTARYFFDALNMDYAGELCFWQVDHKGDIRLQDGALEQCFAAGRALAS